MHEKFSQFSKEIMGIELPVPVSTFGFFFALGLILAFYFLFIELKRRGTKNLIYGSYTSKGRSVILFKLTLKIIFIITIAGLSGAKLLWIINNSEAFMEAPLYVILSADYFVFYGGFFAALVAVVFYAGAIKIKLAHLLDAMAPALMIAYATGRIGCYFSGAYACGVENVSAKPNWLSYIPDWMWYYKLYDNNEWVNNGSNPIFPTQLYEALLCFIIFFVLWIMRKTIPVKGAVFGLCLLLYGFERFLVEEIRNGYNYILFIKQPQFFSLTLIITGGMIFYLLYKKHRNRNPYYGNYLNLEK